MISAQLLTSPIVFQTAEPVLEVLDEIGEVQARNPIISTLAEGQRRIDEDFREGVPVVARIGAPFRAVQQGRNSIELFLSQNISLRTCPKSWSLETCLNL